MILIVSVYCPLTGIIPMFTKQRFVHALLLTVCCVSFATGEPAVNGLSRTVWAEKLPGGTIKAVFLAPYGAQHDSYELMQRMPVEGPVPTMSSLDTGEGYIDWGFRTIGHYWPDLIPTEAEALAEIRKALATDWQVVVMSARPQWFRYPQDIRRSILEKVAAGRGLMSGGFGLDDSVRKDIEAMGLELEKTQVGDGRFETRSGKGLPGGVQGRVASFRAGQGRIINFWEYSLAAHGYLLNPSPLRAEYELSAGRAGWFLLRAARPGVHPYITATRFADGRLTVGMEQGAAPGVEVRICVHRRDTYEKILDTTEKMQRGKPVSVTLPQTPGGKYHAEVRVTDRDGVTLDWDAIRFTVTNDVRLGISVEPQNEISAGDTLRCRLDVEGETAGLETSLRWHDNWGRLLLATAPRPFSQEIEVTAPGGSLSLLNRLEVTVRSKRGPEAVASAELLMPGNVRPADFHMLYWKQDLHFSLAPDSWRRRLQWDVLRRDASADAWANGRPMVNEARDAALCHLSTVPYTTSFHALPLEKELMNPQWLANVEQGARDVARVFRPYRPLGHTLGDENSVTYKPEGRFADVPAVWALFHEYLRDVYTDLDALNAQWETDFAEWDAIRFDNEEQMLPSMDNPSAWVDYRDFVSRHFTQAHQRMRRAIREEDPDALVGWDGCVQFSSYGALDWWEMCRNMEMVNTYHGEYIVDERNPWGTFNGEAISSFWGHTSLRGCFLNASHREFGSAYGPWYLLLNGWNSAWWWQATYLHPANGPLRWDLGLTPIAEPMAAAVKEIKEGPGTLIAHAQKEISPIAVHYSAANYHASTIESGVADTVSNLGTGVAFWLAPELASRSSDEEMRKIWGGITPKGYYAAAAGNIYALLHDIGFEPRTMARQEIEAGVLTESDTRVLILPFVVALSDLEVAKIREFMMGGGVLIADYRCGLRDAHGRLRDTPALDDIFGIKRQSLEVRRGRGTLVADIAGGVRFESIFHDPVIADGAGMRAYHDDGTPALFRHHYSGGSTDSFGWYRLRRKIPAEFAGKNLYLLFESVDEDTHLYINGTKAFEHSCESTGLVPDDIWETSFTCDVTEFLRPGQEDLLAVGVYNRAGMGGIHKPVYLVAAEADLDLGAVQQRVRDGADVLPLPHWRFALDVGKLGMDEKWYAVNFDDAEWAPMRTHTGWQGQGFSGGEAVYLNTDLYGYIDLRRTGRERQLREFFAELLVQVDHLYPPFQIKQRYGAAAGRVEVTRHVDGDTWYCGVMPSFDVGDKAPREVILPFPPGAHVYDVRGQKYLGPGGPIEDTLYVGRAEMYAVLPYVIEGLSVRAPQRVERGEPVEIRIAVAAGTEDIGPHAVRIEVNLPDGRKVEYLGRTLYIEKGEGVFSFVPALNSAVGQWTVTAVEAVCGKQASAGFDVR